MTETAEQKIAIEMKGVVKEGRRKPIGPLDLRIPKGYVVALVGPNGSGKSTIMNLLLQTIHPDAGEIAWYGGPANQMLPLALKQRIGYVPENPALEENFLTARDAAEFRSHWYPTWDQKRFETLVDRFEIPCGERLNRLSKGERRKFEIAAVLAARPKLLLLDEPSSGLDPFAWKDMIEQLRSCLDEEDVTIVISTHVVEEVKRLADFIVLVHQGRIQGMAEKDALFNTWKEVWVRGAEPEELAEVPGVLSCVPDGPSVFRILARNAAGLEMEESAGTIQILKSRSLELDDILELWIQGHPPEELIT
ncbi:MULTISPECIES: ABC transporter ATP-binding protein [Paenibacillus]|uniref:ABC transporter ATP-binding protein n=1 Tax=Paenibacillus TaxID=44249 RepID=UPI002FE276FF